MFMISVQSSTLRSVPTAASDTTSYRCIGHTQPRTSLYLIRVRGRVAGFALVTRGSPATADPLDLDLAEFFVLRSYRRSGVGRRAAVLLWNSLPAHWIVRVAGGPS